MTNDIDKSLLDRLQALRGASEPPESTHSTEFFVDVIDRAKTPTREDALATRLKRLRSRDGTSASPSSGRTPSVSKVEVASEKQSMRSPSSSQLATQGPHSPSQTDDVDDSVFYTDDNTLEELLGDVDTGHGSKAAKEEPEKTEGPSDEQVLALLEELSRSVPQDDGGKEKAKGRESPGNDSENSDGEKMTNEVSDVMERYKDEAQMDAALGKPDDDKDDDPQHDDDNDNDDEEEEQSQQDNGTASPQDFTFPSVPSDPSHSPPSSKPPPTDMDTITARLSALRIPSSSSPTSPTSTSASLSLPAVPTARPSAGKPITRLASKTAYTDADVDGWCTVCLEDATLQCRGCDDDPYCVRCWTEMHVGPAAGFDERGHKAVHISKAKKKEKRRTAVGA